MTTEVTMTGGETAYVRVCAVDDVPPGGGVAALLPDGRQVANFRLPGEQVFALSNIDPLGNAAVLARGIVGDSDGVPVVSSPLLKERYDLRTGECLDAEGVRVRTFDVRVAGGAILLGTSGP